MKTVENSAITSLLLLLDSGKRDNGVSIGEMEKDVICDTIATEVERLIDSKEQAKSIFKAEKKLIADRGNDKENYLSRDSISIKEVLEAYYRGVVDRNEFRRLSSNYSISEMMLMLGTFMHLMEVRNRGLEEVKNRAMQLKMAKVISRMTGRMQTMSQSKKEDMNFLDTLLANTRMSEERMLAYMQDQVTVIMKAILEEMGSNFGLATKRQLERICISSRELASAANVIESYFSTQPFPMVASDVALLDSCGERSPKLYSVLDFTTGTKEKQKRA